MSNDLPVRDLGDEPDTTESNPNPTQDEEVNQNITDDEADDKATRIDEQISDDPTVEEDGATYDPAKQAPPEA